MKSLHGCLSKFSKFLVGHYRVCCSELVVARLALNVFSYSYRAMNVIIVLLVLRFEACDQ